MGGCFDELLGVCPLDALVLNARPEQARDALLFRGERREGGRTNRSQVGNLDLEQVFRLEFEQPSPIDARVGARRRLDVRRVQAQCQGRDRHVRRVIRINAVERGQRQGARPVADESQAPPPEHGGPDRGGPLRLHRVPGLPYGQEVTLVEFVRLALRDVAPLGGRELRTERD